MQNILPVYPKLLLTRSSLSLPRRCPAAADPLSPRFSSCFSTLGFSPLFFYLGLFYLGLLLCLFCFPTCFSTLAFSTLSFSPLFFYLGLFYLGLLLRLFCFPTCFTMTFSKLFPTALLLCLLGFPSCPSTFGVCACPLNWPPPGYPLPGYPLPTTRLPSEGLPKLAGVQFCPPGSAAPGENLQAVLQIYFSCTELYSKYTPFAQNYTPPAHNSAPNIHLLHRTVLQIYSCTEPCSKYTCIKLCLTVLAGNFIQIQYFPICAQLSVLQNPILH